MRDVINIGGSLVAIVIAVYVWWLVLRDDRCPVRRDEEEAA